ncbi:(R,R)-butanediol dehydrogenase NDAI_0H02050 [Naumovozyma dairenensis CBS 421]|uniref:Enoyl reductase (ER) domain-containing protein n=1 Tax=Naumovozyma dairenensis (strain ATCC 10597 / BCRC 20456 / CBS 421 / NBRC 0211 / NRRL Y-12639) TaxID=1071378 RepID=G0WF18_NAUDC|nr:hypothetical protein NDAI_0H02050 [Naumovozyma dairenensis CBS 421]CCD26379.1 hypothetical protein NDAI_0H02050 [Naumovozyma dairenensis CBS 421]
MRAVAYYKKGDIHFSSTLPEPKINSPDEVLIEVSYCGICGTDLHEYTDGPIFFPKDGETNPLSNIPLPQPMGHEFSGFVKAIGSNVTKVEVGDKVVVEAGCGCKDVHRWPDSKLYEKRKDTFCSACENGIDNCCENYDFTGLGVVGGAFAERVVVGERHIVKLPEEVPTDVGALVEPISVAWHAVRVSKFEKGKSALILGAGPIGLAAILALKAHGASKIVVSELAERRRILASKMGVEVFDPSKHGDNAVTELRNIPRGQHGFDYAFDCSGVKATFNTALKALSFRGCAVNVAIWGPKPIDYYPMEITLQEKNLTGSIGYTVQDFEEVVAAMHKGDISIEECRHLITGKYKLEDGWDKGFMELMNHKEKNIKILLTPNNHSELD